MHIHLWTGRMGGHGRIAEALGWALRAARPDARLTVADAYGPATVHSWLARALGGYERLTAAAPPLWGALYHAANSAPALAAVRALGRRLTRRAALPAPAPDVLVNLIADLGPLGALAHGARPRPAVVTVVSDLASVHRAWLGPQAGLVVVPTQAAFEACRALGVPEARLRVLGFPIRAHQFCQAGAPNGRRSEGALRVLVMGGAAGAGRMWADVRALLGAGPPLRVTALCGRNARLRARLQALAQAQGRGRLRVLGYEEDVAGLMRAADLLVTKAGPSTLFEAAALGLPALITSRLPGQEAGNTQFFTSAGTALAAPTPADTARLARRFAEDPSQLRRLRSPALQRETCAAAGRIAAAVLEAAGGGRQ